ncbi:MAG: peptide chain release factor N(5)-glutamine methyltransferase [Pseudomonadota bacterium]
MPKTRRAGWPLPTALGDRPGQPMAGCGSDGQTIEHMLRLGTGRLADASVATPRLDARLLLQHVLDTDHAGLLACSGDVLSTADAERFTDLVLRRLSGEPVARLIGKRGFWTLDLTLGPDTLVPRPDTEILVETVLQHLSMQGLGTRPLRIADLGSGSGAIALALLSELPNALCIASDISQDALSFAWQNAVVAGVADRFRPVVSNWLAALAGPFDLVVSNPPYIRRSDLDELAPEVRLHDPARALDGGADGLDAYRAIFAGLTARPVSPCIVLEIGRGMTEDVTALATEAGFERQLLTHDLAGIERVVMFARTRLSSDKVR